MNQYNLVSREFGYPIYVEHNGNITDNPEDAEVFDDRDNHQLKEMWWSRKAGHSFRMERVQ